jgi:hypothetical protein
VTGWKKTPVTAGCWTPKRRIAPTSCSFTRRSTAAASETVTPASAQRLQRPQLVVGERLAADRDLRRLVESVELQVDVNAELGEGEGEARIASQPDAVGVEHHQRDSAFARGREHLEDLGVDRGLAARELHRLGLALGANERVEHRFDLLEGQ